MWFSDIPIWNYSSIKPFSQTRVSQRSTTNHTDFMRVSPALLTCSDPLIERREKQLGLTRNRQVTVVKCATCHVHIIIPNYGGHLFIWKRCFTGININYFFALLYVFFFVFMLHRALFLCIIIAIYCTSKEEYKAIIQLNVLIGCAMAVTYAIYRHCE